MDFTDPLDNVEENNEIQAESNFETNIGEHSSLDENLSKENVSIEQSEIEETSSNEKSNGLEGFGIEQMEEQTPDLFDSAISENTNENEFTSFDNENSEEDELEIPAFLRRQKN